MKTDIIHLYLTSKCTNKCALCCNKDIDFSKVKVVTDKELKSANTICLTGGDPFLLNNLDNIVNKLRKYENIENIYVFTSGLACLRYIRKYSSLPNIDGITFSPKSKSDWEAIELISDYYSNVVSELKSNRLYCFINKYDDCNYTTDDYNLDVISDTKDVLNYQLFFRTWVEHFDSPTNEIFRKYEKVY